MNSLVAFWVLLTLTVWVTLTAVRIEQLNAKAGFYLPRNDEDGTWRTSRMNDTPHDQLHGLVSGIGLLQYLLAPSVVALGVAQSVTTRRVAFRRFGACAAIVGMAAWALALYRGYFSSLGM